MPVKGMKYDTKSMPHYKFKVYRLAANRNEVRDHFGSVTTEKPASCPVIEVTVFNLTTTGWDI